MALAPRPVLGKIQNIRELQAYERALFNKLQALETSQVSPDSQSTIIANINTVSRTRTNLFNELQIMLQQEQCALSNDRYDLADQIALLNVTEAELNRIKEQIQALKQRRVNKIRMVEITNYETDRYGAHRNIFKNVAFCALGVIFSLYLVNRGWTSLGKTGIILSIGAGVILTIKSIFDAWWRSPMNWNQYQQVGGVGGDHAGDTVWAHDVNAFWKGVGEAKLATDIAIGEAGAASSIIGGEVSDAAATLERGTKKAAGGGGNGGCQHNWWFYKPEGKCLQECPLAAQTRNAAGHCKCGMGGNNQNCVQGTACIGNICV